jgi:hypothetical protein
MGEKAQRLNICPCLVENAGSALTIIQSHRNVVMISFLIELLWMFSSTRPMVVNIPLSAQSHLLDSQHICDYPETESLYAGQYLSRDTVRVSVSALAWARRFDLLPIIVMYFFHCHIE